LGTEVVISTTPEGTKTYEQLVADGIYQNNLDSQTTTIVPKMTPMMLRVWTDIIKTKKDVNPKTSTLNKHLCKIFELEQNFNWQQFEEFHALWEVLRHSINPKPSSSILEWYCNSGIHNKDFKDQCFHINSTTSYVKLNQNFPEHSPVADNQKISFLDCDKVALIGKTNPGFDIFTLVKGTARPYLGFALECRFSTPNSTTKLNMHDIIDKHNKTIAQDFQKQLGVQLESDDIYLIVVAWRNTTQLEPEKLPKNVLVLDKPALSKFYTCFANSPQFMLEQ